MTIFSFRFLGLATAILAGVFGMLFLRWYPDYLWFQSFGFGEYWFQILSAQVQSFLIFFAIAWTVLTVNVRIALFVSRGITQRTADRAPNTPYEILNQLYSQYQQFRRDSALSLIPQRFHRNLMSVVILGISLLMGLTAKNWWLDFYLWLKQTPFESTDPIFHHDIAFYIFSLPLFKDLYSWVLSLFFISIALSLWVYFSRNMLAIIFVQAKYSRIKTHLFTLAAILFFCFAFGAQLSSYNLLYSATGTVFGAGYTDIHAQLLALRVLLIGLVIQAILFLLWGFRRGFRLPVYFLGLIIISWVLLGNVYPSLIQSYIVEPNEIQKESPYIRHNIQLTREAYGLDKIKEAQVPFKETLSAEEVAENRSTFDNLRLWNLEPLKQTFKQLQEIRLYYDFAQIDVDRYQIDGQLRQVMLSPRELDINQIPVKAQNWVNQHLFYTHGYGLCLSPINEFTSDGLPSFLIKDLPPMSSMDIQVTRPEIYFGEKTDTYAVVNTTQPEFNYPKGNENDLTHYAGPGGVQLDSLFRRALFAWKFSDMKLLISRYITPESRLLYDRNIRDIVQKLLPFLHADSDPYLVLSDDGRMLWLWDAYTLSSDFPYSEPINGSINYMRNAVLVSIDAYSGDTHIYIKDHSDPIIRSISKVFPALLKPLSEMPADIRAHIRYPKQLFSIQAYMYQTYHMTDAQAFFNREDLWNVPQESQDESARSPQWVKPYYIVLKLPEQDQESFVLMQTFTPANKNNLVSWLTVDCDPSNYGDMVSYRLPKERTIYGPLQIESRIDQDTQISQSLTLWGQMGSKVIRGNLMVLPVANSLVYAEPIYLQATQSKLPELKRVILSHNDKIIMSESLDEGIQRLLGVSTTTKISDYAPTQTPSSDSPSTMDQWVDRLISVHRRIRSSLEALDFKAFGSALDELDQSVHHIQTLKEEE